MVQIVVATRPPIGRTLPAPYDAATCPRGRPTVGERHGNVRPPFGTGRDLPPLGAARIPDARRCSQHLRRRTVLRRERSVQDQRSARARAFALAVAAALSQEA